MFDFEWTSRRDADDADEERGIEAVERYCRANDIDPAETNRAALEAIENWPRSEADNSAIKAWSILENIAIAAMCEGWRECTENATLTWVEMGESYQK